MSVLYFFASVYFFCVCSKTFSLKPMVSRFLSRPAWWREDVSSMLAGDGKGWAASLPKKAPDRLCSSWEAAGGSTGSQAAEEAAGMESKGPIYEMDF